MSERGLIILFTSNWLGSFLTIRDRQTRAFFRTAGADLFERAKSKTASVRFVRAEGMIVANIERAKD